MYVRFFPPAADATLNCQMPSRRFECLRLKLMKRESVSAFDIPIPNAYLRSAKKQRQRVSTPNNGLKKRPAWTTEIHAVKVTGVSVELDVLEASIFFRLRCVNN
jgi:hypothetical protein